MTTRSSTSSYDSASNKLELVPSTKLLLIQINHNDSYYSLLERHECFKQFLTLNCFDQSFSTQNSMITQ